MPIRDQANEGACSSFATRGLREYAHYQATGQKPKEWFSTAFNYYQARIIEGTFPQDSGATGGDELQGDVTYGTCFESDMPYTADPTAVPAAQAIADALAFRIPQGSPIFVPSQGTASIISELAQNNCVSIGIAVYSSFEQFVKDDGIIPMPNITTEQLLGYHEVLACCYDLTHGYIGIRNSWSAAWGDTKNGNGGYGYLPLSYFDSLCIEGITIPKAA